MGYPSRRGPKPLSEQKVPLKGLFSDGEWKCICDPRQRARLLETKNGGVNHGRWFYKCGKPQHLQCDFFLWEDEAKLRDGKAVLEQSRKEPMTPMKNAARSAGVTPQSKGADATSPEFRTPFETPSKPGYESPTERPKTSEATPALRQIDSEEFCDWPASDEEELARVADKETLYPPQTPRKMVNFSFNATPRKRLFDDMDSPEKSFLTTHNDDVFSTPATSTKATNPSGLLSPMTTPTPNRFRNVASEDSELATEIIDALKKLYVPLPEEAISAIKGIAGRQKMKMQGVEKGRDVSRAALKTKDGMIAELQGKNAAYEARQESDRIVIAHLKNENDCFKRILEVRGRVETLNATGKSKDG